MIIRQKEIQQKYKYRFGFEWSNYSCENYFSHEFIERDEIWFKKSRELNSRLDFDIELNLYKQDGFLSEGELESKINFASRN